MRIAASWGLAATSIITVRNGKHLSRLQTSQRLGISIHSKGPDRFGGVGFRSCIGSVQAIHTTHAIQSTPRTMGKKKQSAAYNDFLDGEKLTDNAEVRTTLQAGQSLTRGISPPAPAAQRQHQPTNPQTNHTPPTHFLCLPLISPTTLPHLSSSLSSLATTLAETTTLPASAVRPPSTLHITLGVLSLTPSRLPVAVAYLDTLDLAGILRDVSQRLAAERAASQGIVAEGFMAGSLPAGAEVLKVNLEGLRGMRDVKRTGVCFAVPRDDGDSAADGRLGGFAKEVRRNWVDEGLMKSEEREWLAHVTVVNSIYAKGGRGKGKGKGRVMFDASELVERYEGFVWAAGVEIDRVCLCKMGAKDIVRVGEEGEEVKDQAYEVVAEKKIFA